MNRRHFLATVSATTLLTACSTTPGNNAQLVSDVALVVAGVQAVAPVLLPRIVNADTAAQVQGWITQAGEIAKQIASAVSSTDTKAMVQQLVQIVQQVLSIAAPLLAGTEAGPILMAAQVLLPVILSYVGITAPAMAGEMTPEQARSVLRMTVVRR